MKNLVNNLFLLLILLGTGCTERLYVSSDYDKSAELIEYQTFNWAENQEKPSKGYPQFDNDINRKRIKEAIEEELGRIGLGKVDSMPDLLVDFHLLVDEKVNYIAHDYYPYPFTFRYWPNYDISSYTVKTSTIVIHLVDFKKEQLVWQGTGSWTLVDPPTSEERIKIAIEEILDQFQKTRKKR
jgi:hypothetical protein